ncbi:MULTISPECIES: antitoxin family protein [unclassified Archaeoglobus]|jgi:predicted DNA-binding antitoxin AbrB/MazE fold protein|uniref:antitoxin family protein n=1 Tax=unclassified Archaeoglobus TaxID=2643606 RepID=UPI0025B9E231|nr:MULTISPECIES: antitoxin family protein [unclassified Archaeoglobus]
MGKIIEAIYENGVFKPLERVDLKEGEKVRLKLAKNLAERLKKYQIEVERDLVAEFIAERR